MPQVVCNAVQHTVYMHHTQIHTTYIYNLIQFYDAEIPQIMGVTPQ